MRAAPLLILVLLTLLVACSLTIPGSSADIPSLSGSETISGVVDLDADRTYADGSSITILPGTELNVHSFTLDFGRDSTVRILGTANISSENGNVVIRSGTTLVFLGEKIHSFDSDAVFTYDGTISFSEHLMDEHMSGFDYHPNGSDNAVRVYVDDYVLSVCDPMMSMTVTGGNVTRTFGFSSFTIIETLYDGGEAVTVTTTVIMPADRMNVVTVVYTSEGMDVTIGLSWISTTTEYKRTGIVDSTDITGIGSIHMTVDTAFMAHLTASAERLVSIREVGGQRDNTVTFETITLDTEADLDKIIQLIKESISGEGEGPNIIRYLNIDISRWTIVDSQGKTKKQLDNISIRVDGSETAEHYLVVTADDDGSEIRLTSTKPKVQSYSISRDLVIDLDARVERITYVVSSAGEPVTTVSVDQLQTEVNDFDARAIATIYSMTGNIELQQLLDNSHRIHAATGSIYWANKTGSDVKLYDADILLMKDSKDLNTLEAKFSGVEGTLHGDETTEFSIDRSELYMESNGSITECINVFLSGTDFTTDAHSEIQVYNSGFSVQLTSDGNTYRLMSGKSSTLSPTFATLSMSVDHSMYQDATFLNGKVSDIGYYMTFTSDVHYTDPEGYSNVIVTTNDMSGSFEMELGDGMSFSIWLQMPWDIDVAYYDIKAHAIVKGSTLSMTHGRLSVDDFDYRAQGLKDLPDAIRNGDFRVNMKVDLSADRFDLYKGEEEELFNSYSDFSLYFKDLGVDMKRGVSLLISIKGMNLEATPMEGNAIGRSIPNLDIYKDLTGEEDRKGFLEKAALPLMVIFISVSVIVTALMIFLRIKRPHLFKIKERSAEDDRDDAS